MANAAPERLAALPIDWDGVEQEAVDHLRRYLRIDTTNPPGGEEAGAALLAEALRRDGIEPTLHEAAAGRISVSARLPGTNGAGTRPLVLLSHIDVVPAERRFWTRDPFAADLDPDGTIWGRGALDMKGMGVMELMVLLLLRRLRVPHRRDVVFVAVADEEEGGRFGMGWLAERHPELLEADGVINEGAFGFGDLLGRRGLVFGVSTTEKAPLWLRLRVEGPTGHGSLPKRGNAAARLARALARVAETEAPIRLLPEMERTLSVLQQARLLPPQLDLRDPGVLAAAAQGNDLLRALLANSVSLTTLEAGAKHNVIPAEARATLDCRLLPGEDVDRFLDGLRARIDDDAVRIEVVYRFDPIVSPIGSELLEHVEATIRAETDGGVVLPMISPGFSDSRFYRRRGVPAVGFVPALLTGDELGTVHGHDERISRANLGLGIRLLLDTVRRAAGAR
jgi:acetylornithine deacetylase/succinyl-diaminopimelate desuccinylase-like protein